MAASNNRGGAYIASDPAMHHHDAIDRVSPTLEPDQTALMRQDWHHLLFLHWEIPVLELQALVPPELTIDTYEGKAYVGLIPFTLTNVRPVLTPPLPGISSFHEINVRTYVHYQGKDPGVWFFSLDASSTIAVAAARAAYHLRYFHSNIDFTPFEFTSHRDDSRGPMPAHSHIRWAPVEGPFGPAAAGSLDHFLCERYILYSADEEHRLYRARVHHQAYPLQKADVLQLEETLIWAADIRRADSVPLRHYAREVNVKVYPPERVT